MSGMVRLCEIAAVVSGLSPTKRRSGGVRYVQIKDLTPVRRALVFGLAPTAGRALPIKRTDVLIAARGNGPLATRPDDELVDAYPALDLYLVRPEPTRLDPDFLVAYLNSGPGGAQLRAAACGGTLPRIPKEAVEHLTIPIPSLEVQKRLGAYEAARAQYAMLSERRVNADKRLIDAVVRMTIYQQN